MEKFADFFMYFVIIVVALALRFLYKENKKSKEKENPEEQQQLQQQLYSNQSIHDYANILNSNAADMGPVEEATADSNMQDLNVNGIPDSMETVGTDNTGWSGSDNGFGTDHN